MDIKFSWPRCYSIKYTAIKCRISSNYYCYLVRLYIYLTMMFVFCMLHSGTADLIKQHPSILAAMNDSTSSTQPCQKNLGDNMKKLRKWSRGHQFIVRAGGHIDTWQPIYKLVFLSVNKSYTNRTCWCCACWHILIKH